MIYREYTTMQCVVLPKSRKQLSTKRMYGHLPPISQTIQVKRTRHVGHCGKSRAERISDVLPCNFHLDPSVKNLYSSALSRYRMLCMDLTKNGGQQGRIARERKRDIQKEKEKERESELMMSACLVFVVVGHDDDEFIKLVTSTSNFY